MRVVAVHDAQLRRHHTLHSVNYLRAKYLHVLFCLAHNFSLHILLYASEISGRNDSEWYGTIVPFRYCVFHMMQTKNISTLYLKWNEGRK